jgi:hypothetical protein
MPTFAARLDDLDYLINSKSARPALDSYELDCTFGGTGRGREHPVELLDAMLLYPLDVATPVAEGHNLATLQQLCALVERQTAL